ncbi:response regulator transcription factor [Paenibacillus thermotolerans]|uniref:response regulator transcription factor n=1 Tax=Paenibacillus thermotolerans TaxID=3027807 RepID=UPI002367C0DE|nr:MULTISPECIES: response regulator transcription factor [unclassified Paenibacillus]
MLLIDDHSTVAEGTKALIEQENDMIVEMETDPFEVLHRIQFHKYDLFLLDLYMPAMNGVELSKKILSIQPEARIVIYSGFDIAPHFNMLIETGVAGFVSKTGTKDQLITSIRCAMRNDMLLPVSLVRQLRRIGVVAEGSSHFAERIVLTEKENEVLLALSKGLPSKDISKKLLMSQRTVEYNITNIFKKLNVKTRLDAVTKAKELGLLPAEHLN